MECLRGRLDCDVDGVYTAGMVPLQAGESVTRRRGRYTKPDMAEVKPVPVRIPDKIKARVEAHRQRLLQLTGIEPSRSEVILMLIERGLAVVESEPAPKKR